MKRLFRLFGLAVGSFIIACALSYFARSDDHGLPGGHDCVRRLGFPFIIWEQGGFAYHQTFSLAALMADLAFATVVSAAIAIIYARTHPLAA